MRETILIVDDDPAQLWCLRRLIAGRGHDFTIVEANDFARARRALDRLRARGDGLVAAFLDVVLPGGSGLDLIPLVEEKHPHARIIVMTAYLECEVARRAQDAGALFLPKPIGPAALATLLRRRRPPAERPIALLAHFVREHRLSRRQQEVIEGRMAGLDHKQIASRMGVKVNTVGSHAARIFDKTGCRGKANVLKAVLVPDGLGKE
ncbi:MAG: response regulator transcription factor [Anaerolineae bacterium]|nr:response regulator transcription factor [Anaerolineae bacterium]